MSDSNGTSLLRLWVTTSWPSFTHSSAFPRDARLVNGTQSVDRKRIDNNITRQPHHKLVQNITVHLPPRTDSDHIMCARVRLPGRNAHNRKQRTPTVRKNIDRREITSDVDRRERLIQLIASQLTRLNSGAQSAKKWPFSPTQSYGPQRR